MDRNSIFNQIIEDINVLFGKIFTYNSKLLSLCNDKNYEPNFTEIFDFYITSHAMTFLKNFYLGHIESQCVFLNARCIIEGLALKEGFKNGSFNESNVALLMHQDSLIEYNQYKKFKNIYESFLMPDDLKQKYEEAFDYYTSVLNDLFDDKEIKQIINSQIPFLCNPKMTYQRLVKEQLGEQMASYYSILSSKIHPTTNILIDSKSHTFLLLDVYHLIKDAYDELPIGEIDLRTLSMFLFSNKDAERFNDLIKAECTQLEQIQADFQKNFGNNYVTDTFHMLSMQIQEVMVDKVFGFSEQVKSKWKVIVETLASFYEVYLNSEDVEKLYRLLDCHSDLALTRIAEDRTAEEQILRKAFEYYKDIYPNGVEFEPFCSKFYLTTGFTIDEMGCIKNLTQLVNQLAELFEDTEQGQFAMSDFIKLNYVESQMISHANGYLWFANSGAWGDDNPIFMGFNCLLSFICSYMSNIFRDGYNQTKLYKDKKTANILKQASKFIRSNSFEITEILKKQTGKMFNWDSKFFN